MKKKTVKKLGTRQLIKKCDIVFSKIVRSLGKCERCGRDTNLQCAHIMSRRHLQTRHDLTNAICLCYSCHLHWAHKEPFEFVAWVNKKYGEDTYEQIRKKSMGKEKIDWNERYEALKDLVKRL